jgi:hypothetical protein
MLGGIDMLRDALRDLRWQLLSGLLGWMLGYVIASRQMAFCMMKCTVFNQS